MPNTSGHLNSHALPLYRGSHWQVAKNEPSSGFCCTSRMHLPCMVHGKTLLPGHSIEQSSPRHPPRHVHEPSSSQIPRFEHGLAAPPTHSTVQLPPRKPGKHSHFAPLRPSWTQVPLLAHTDPYVLGHSAVQLTPAAFVCQRRHARHRQIWKSAKPTLPAEVASARCSAVKALAMAIAWI
jgi:hypothetical protein